MKVYILSLFFYCIFLLPPSATATDVSGTLTANTSWTKTGSPYIVTGDILVEDGVTLTIEPGVEVRFNACRALCVDGTLVARGAFDDHVIFTSNHSPPNRGDWKSIIFRQSSADAVFDADDRYLSGCILEFCTVQYAGATPDWAALHLRDASPYISHVHIGDNFSHGICCEYAASPVIDNCTITRNYGGALTSSPTCVKKDGINCRQTSSPLLINCAIFHNDGNGIICSASSSPTVSNCLIHSNGECGIRSSSNTNPTITRCTIADNYYTGVTAETCDGAYFDPLFTANRSSITWRSDSS